MPWTSKAGPLSTRFLPCLPPPPFASCLSMPAADKAGLSGNPAFAAWVRCRPALSDDIPGAVKSLAQGGARPAGVISAPVCNSEFRQKRRFFNATTTNSD